ncbi:hypothetical protein [Paucilactobacillus sp. N302-9]
MAEKKLQNTLGDLNNHLFAEMERLGDESLTPEQLSDEINRAEAISKVAGNIVQNANTVLKAKVAFGDNYSADPKDHPRMLEGGD